TLVDEENYATQDSTFIVSVINDEDNPNYIPPKGVFGEYDEINQIRSKEQSLVLKFNNLGPRFKGAAKKILAMDQKKGQSFLMYERMKMFIYGNSENLSNEETDLKFFIQFGNGNEYYKVTKPIYEGWDEDLKRNEINLDLDWLTSLKNETIDTINLIGSNDTFVDSTEYKRYTSFSNESNVNKKVEIFGNPSLSRLQYFIVGVENDSDHPVSGELWLDELRLSEVKKEKGTALRLKSKFNLSDLSETTISYSKKDADFHVLQERIGTNQTVENFTLTNNFKLGNLFPSSLGIAFPVNVNYNSASNSPKFFPGTDIRTNGAVPDSIIVKSSTVNLTGKISKRVKSENPLIKYSLDNLSAGFNISTQNKSDVIMKSVDINKINTNVDYNLRFPSDSYIEAFGWAKRIPFVGDEISKTKFFYTPSSFSTGLRVNRSLTEKYSRQNNELVEDFALGLERKFIVNYKVFDNTQLNYSKNIRSDMSDYRDEVLKNLKIGLLTNQTESLNYTFSPQWISWFKPNFTYNTNFTWNKPLNSVIDAANLNLVKNTGVNFSISPTQVIESFYTPLSKRKSKSSSRTRSRTSGLESTNLKDNESKVTVSNSEKNDSEVNSLFLEKIYNYSQKIEPLNITITNITNMVSNGVDGDIPLAYKLGFKDSHGIDSVPEVGLNTGNEDIKRSFTARTGIRFNPKTSLAISFNESISSNINGYSIDIRSTSRDYISFGENLSKGFPFINWSLRIGGLEKINFINPYVSSISIEHAFSGKQNISWKFNEDGIAPINLFKITHFENEFNDSIQLSRVSRSLSPLIGISTSFKNGISTNLRSNITHTLDEVATGLTFVTDNSILATITYNFSKGIRFNLPFSDRNINLRNNMNISLNFDFSEKKEQGSKDKINFVEQNFSNTNKSILRITYTLTDDITGSLFYEYRETDTRLTGKRIDRDFGINFNVAIRG
ncbi:MAG: hypothetical protein VW963_07265, partial [Candidatus Neomarinimicrobiota bacterium]